MIVTKVIVEINITGSIISRTSDNIIVSSLCGTFSQLPLILALCNPKNRKLWYKREYDGSTTPDISIYLMLGKNSLPITENQLSAFIKSIRAANIDFINFENNLLSN